MSRSKSGGGQSLAKSLREGASCALRGLLAGNEEQMAAAEAVLEAATETVRLALRHLQSTQAEREAQTGVERAQLIKALATEMEVKGALPLPPAIENPLQIIAEELLALGPSSDSTATSSSDSSLF